MTSKRYIKEAGPITRNDPHFDEYPEDFVEPVHAYEQMVARYKKRGGTDLKLATSIFRSALDLYGIARYSNDYNPYDGADGSLYGTEVFAKDYLTSLYNDLEEDDEGYIPSEKEYKLLEDALVYGFQMAYDEDEIIPGDYYNAQLKRIAKQTESARLIKKESSIRAMVKEAFGEDRTEDTKYMLKEIARLVELLQQEADKSLVEIAKALRDADLKRVATLDEELKSIMSRISLALQSAKNLARNLGSDK